MRFISRWNDPRFDRSRFASSLGSASHGGGVVSGAAPAPANLVAPRFTGSMTQGKTLTRVAGVWPGSPTVTQRWLADAVAIGGATGTTFVLTATQLAADITLEESADYGGGVVIVATSDARGPVITEAAVYAAAVASMTSAGLDSIIDAVWVLGGASVAEAAINRLAPGTLDLTVGGAGPNFLAYTGTVHGGTTNQFSAFNPFAGGFNFVLDSNSMGVWSVTDASNSLASMGFGNFLLNPQASPDIPRYRNGTTTTDSFSGVTDALGLIINTRNGSSGHEVYKDKDLIESQVRTSSAISDGAFWINGWTDGVSIHRDTTRRLALAFMGAGLSEAQVAAFTDIWGLCLNQLGTVIPEAVRLYGAFDGPDLLVAADVAFGYETGTRTKLVVAAAADTGFAAPLFDGDVRNADLAGFFRPVKHTATGLPANTDIIFKVEVLRP